MTDRKDVGGHDVNPQASAKTEVESRSNLSRAESGSGLASRLAERFKGVEGDELTVIREQELREPETKAVVRMKNPSHPGRVLREEFMKPFGVSAYKLAETLGVTRSWLNDLVHENQRMSADMALRLAKHFSNTPEFWMNLQQNFDLASAQTDVSGIPVFEAAGS